jgi:hypothetical protein
MNVGRLRPKPGEDLALFLSSVVNDAIRDATEAGLSNTDAIRVVFGLVQSWQVLGPPATERHGQTPCTTRTVGAPTQPICVYLDDGTKVRVARSPETRGPAWLEVVPQDILHPAVNHGGPIVNHNVK